MKTPFLAGIIAVFLLIFSLYAMPAEPDVPPIAQPLVREGEFARELVAALKMTPTQSEAEAESLLTMAGIVPQKGWIADYPVTPLSIVEIEKGVAAAAAAGKLGMGKDEALKAVGALKGKLGMNVNPWDGPRSAPLTLPDSHPAQTLIYKYIDKGGVVNYTDRYETIPMEYRKQIEPIRQAAQISASEDEPGAEDPGKEADTYAANPEPDVINNYYLEEGPPVVTYYPPPDAYYGQYSWVPYPFRCSGIFFPGFFILRDFHRPIFLHKKAFVVSNHFYDGHAKKVITVDPHQRILRGTVAFKGAGSGVVSGREGIRQGTVFGGRAGSTPDRIEELGKSGGANGSASQSRGSGKVRSQPIFKPGLDRGREKYSGPERTTANRGGTIRGMGDANRRSDGEAIGHGSFGSEERIKSPAGKGRRGFSDSNIRQDPAGSGSFSEGRDGSSENRGFDSGRSSGSGGSFKGVRGGGGKGGR